MLIDLKTEKISHQDVGQMDMYIRMYDELKRNEQLFASKYKLYLPTEEELKAEIEAQKAMFYLQQQEKK